MRVFLVERDDGKVDLVLDEEGRRWRLHDVTINDARLAGEEEAPIRLESLVLDLKDFEK